MRLPKGTQGYPIGGSPSPIGTRASCCENRARPGASQPLARFTKDRRSKWVLPPSRRSSPYRYQPDRLAGLHRTIDTGPGHFGRPYAAAERSAVPKSRLKTFRNSLPGAPAKPPSLRIYRFHERFRDWRAGALRIAPGAFALSRQTGRPTTTATTGRTARR